MSSSQILPVLRTYIDGLIQNGSNLQDVIKIFNDTILPHKFDRFDDKSVRRLAQIIVTEYITGTKCKSDNVSCLPIKETDIDYALFDLQQ